MKFSPIDLYQWFESIYIMAHLVPPKCSFHTRTYTIMITLSMSYFKKDPSMLSFFLLVKLTQLIKSTCWLELLCKLVWPKAMLCELYVVFSKWYINQAKAMLNEQCVMNIIITNVEMVLLNHITWLRSAIHTVNMNLCMFIKDIYEYIHLILIIVLTPYLSLGIKCVILNEFYHG